MTKEAYRYKDIKHSYKLTFAFPLCSYLEKKDIACQRYRASAYFYEFPVRSLIGIHKAFPLVL